MNCKNCDTPYTVIERNLQGLEIGFRCPRCDDEYWPYDQESPPEADMETWHERDLTCPTCHGTGQDWDLTPCGKCDGEGYLWWLT